MHRASLVVAALLLAGCAQGPEAPRPQPDDGLPEWTIQGHVVDEDGSIIEGVTIYYPDGSGRTWSTNVGQFVVQYAEPGFNLIKFEMAGYRTVEQLLEGGTTDNLVTLMAEPANG